MLIELKRESFRDKVLNCYDKYLTLSDKQSIAIGIYKNGKKYVFGNGTHTSFMYDIGSISKTITAHLIIKLSVDKKIQLNKSVSEYLPLKKGSYPTIEELLTHSAGYNNLTPVEFTITGLLTKNYSKRNIYENKTSKKIIKSLEKRNNHKTKNKYGYSDFAYAVLAVVIEHVCNKTFSEVFDDFIKNELKLTNTFVALKENRYPFAIYNKKEVSFWNWNMDNPYLASGGIVSNIKDMLIYLSLQIESKDKYITLSHEVNNHIKTNSTIRICKGWHTYEKSNRLWHVGGVGTFRSSIIINKKEGFGVVVLGNTKGVSGSNVHYLTKMIYSELKAKKVRL